MNSQSEETRQIWNRIAAWWDDAIGDGNEFQQQLIMPTTDRLLDPKPGQSILDIACGNGNYARQLSRKGAKVTAIDFSEVFIERAKQRTTEKDGSIDYKIIDATDESQLLSLGHEKFDSAVCSMAMMDMPTIDPLLRALNGLLKQAGRFVFSLPHPCFNSSYSRMTAELVNEDGKLEQIYGVSIRKYITAAAEKSSGILNQPEPHYFFHRPLTMVFASCFAAGFIVDGFEEPAYPREAGAKNAFAWAKRPEIPPAVVIRVLKSETR